MSVRSSFVVLLGVLALVVVGCSPAGKAAHDQGPQTVLEVINRNSGDMNVYVVRSGQRTRLGRIGGNQRRNFTLPARVVVGASRLILLADPVGSMMRPMEVPFAVLAGDDVQVIIPAY